MLLAIYIIIIIFIRYILLQNSRVIYINNVIKEKIEFFFNFLCIILGFSYIRKKLNINYKYFYEVLINVLIDKNID